MIRESDGGRKEKNASSGQRDLLVQKPEVKKALHLLGSARSGT